MVCKGAYLFSSISPTMECTRMRTTWHVRGRTWYVRGRTFFHRYNQYTINAQTDVDILLLQSNESNSHVLTPSSLTKFIVKIISQGSLATKIFLHENFYYENFHTPKFPDLRQLHLYLLFSCRIRVFFISFTYSCRSCIQQVYFPRKKLLTQEKKHFGGFFLQQ